MTTCAQEYETKRTNPADAIRLVKSGNTVVYGMSISQPPALLTALADAARAGSLKDVRIYTFLPREHAARSVLAPDLCDCLENYSWFVGAVDRDLTKVGLNDHVPSYLHQIPTLVAEFMEADVVMTTVSPMDTVFIAKNGSYQGCNCFSGPVDRGTLILDDLFPGALDGVDNILYRQM